MREFFAICAFMLAGSGAAAPATLPPVAAFDYVDYFGKDDGNGCTAEDCFTNPVIPGFQPDPSIVRVGNDYYLVNSTFAWFPGIPVYHSRDLVNWRQVGNAIDRPGQLDFSGLGVTRAVFAPTIEYHRGKFYILNTCIECRGNFVLTADDPAGPWSDPIWLDFEGIDPSLFVDDDGRAWIVNNGAPVGKPEYDGHRAIWIQELDLVALKMKGPRSVLVDKGVDPAAKPIWAEGPHLYRKDGFYYLLAAEGGTADQHSQTIYRSKSVTGPYVPGPVNPILTQRDLPEDRPNPVQAAGHADFVELPDGSWWSVFLATRPYAGQQTNLGRETFLLPVSWKDGWPLILRKGVAIPLAPPRPNLPADKPVSYGKWRDEFVTPKLDDDWIMLRTPGPSPWRKVDGGRGKLLLTALPVAAGSLKQPAYIGKRLRHHAASFETALTFVPKAKGDRAGLLALTDENHFLFVGIEHVGKQRPELVIRQRKAASDPAAGQIVATVPFKSPVKGSIELRLEFDSARARFLWRPYGHDKWQVASDAIDASVLATIGAGLFTGAVVGPHAARAEPGQ